MATRKPHPGFAGRYPLSVALNLLPVSTFPGVEHEGFDIDEVSAALGATRFQKFLSAKIYNAGVPAGRAAGELQVFSCGHRKWPHQGLPPQHPEAYKQNAEVHCVYAQDLEQFLAQGG